MNRRLFALVLFVAFRIAVPPITASADEHAAVADSHGPRLLAVFIGGMDSDPTPEQLAGIAARNRGNSGMYQLCRDCRHERVIAEYFNWNGTRAGELKAPQPPRSPAIADHIREHLQQHPWDRVALVGNSWGGHTALEVVRLLRRNDAPLAVDLVVFLDASSTGRAPAPPRELPENVNRVVQFRTRNVFVWPALPRDRRFETIDLGDPTAGYMQEGRPAYAASFDFQAHVAAEWDERIHGEIKQKLLELLAVQ